MILADKIINERKRNGWSQEELAEKLSVSRQSVSKWEGAQAVPDLSKIIKMADLFGVSTDYLLKDEIEITENSSSVSEHTEPVPPLKKVSLEEANEFIELKKYSDQKVSLGVFLCICSPLPLLFLLALLEGNIAGITENVACAIGIIALLLMICGAVFIFICFGGKAAKYEFLYKEAFETEYGVDGMVKEKKARLEDRKNKLIACGVVMIIASVIPLIGCSVLEVSDMFVLFCVCLLLAVVAIAVVIFINASTVTSACDALLQTGDYSPNAKKNNKKMAPIASIYWCLTTAIYLGYSFITNGWERSWIVWPVAAVLYAVVRALAMMVMKLDED